jgi:hypothetical protein
MVTVFRCFAGVAASWAVVTLGPSAVGQAPYPLSPNPMIAPGVSLQQYAYNTAVLGRAYRNIPPYILGYNPYPQSVNYGSPYGSRVFQPAMYNPSAAGYGAGTSSTGGYNSSGGYSSSGGSTPYYGGNSYGGGGYTAGGVDPLTGQSSSGSSGGGYSGSGGGDYALKAYGKLGLDMEQARILREKADQATLDTRKKRLDTLAYVRANEYTFTQQQIDIANRILERVQKMPTSQEIASGRSLNILMEDLEKLAGLPVRASAVMLDEDVLKLLNVTGQTGSGNIGLLRDNGRFAWPSAFDENNVAGDKEKKDVELHAQELFQQSVNAKVDKNAVKDLGSSLRVLRASLSKSVKEVPGQSFLEGQRFLDDFDAALVALGNGDAVVSLDFQQKFARDGKTVQELVDYMKNKGLRFAPANPGDERVYRVLQAALAAHSIMLHNLINAAAKE